MHQEYSKNCPHCGKYFHARRLNQVYCTYRCKVRFNNERARVRRLSLLEIEKNHLASNAASIPKIMEIKKQESVPEQNQPLAKEKESPTSNWKDWIFIGLMFLAVGSFLYWIFRRLNKKEREVIPEKTLAQDSKQFPINQNSKGILAIPVDIYPKLIKEDSSVPKTSTKKVEQDLSQDFFKNHPDVIAHQKILRKNKII